MYIWSTCEHDGRKRNEFICLKQFESVVAISLVEIGSNKAQTKLMLCAKRFSSCVQYSQIDQFILFLVLSLSF